MTCISLALCAMGDCESEAVYRCGNAYSSSMQCAHENATEVNAHSEPYRQAPATSQAITHEQREADALEKKRLQSERQATQSQAVRVLAVPAQNSTAQVPQTSQQGQKTHRSPSPYFTAKDPVKPAKNAVKN